jgi:hypothetical protein
MPYLSIIINADTRPEKSQQDGLFNGCRNEDFLTDGVFNKVKFFYGFDKEVIVFVDEHIPVPEKTLEYLRAICDTVVIRRHTDEPKFNDFNYTSALQLARGEIVVHFDQDTAAFTSSPQHIHDMITMLEKYDYISYPSIFSPNPDNNPNYDYYWCSTRFFMCKRETLDFTEINKCLRDSDYLYGKYPASVKNPWTEHAIALISKYTGKGVYYPPINISNYTIFSWANYEKYTLRRLNEMPYEEVRKFVDAHPIGYPCDITL